LYYGRKHAILSKNLALFGALNQAPRHGVKSNTFAGLEWAFFTSAAFWRFRISHGQKGQ
jgi:hypothetical protein